MRSPLAFLVAVCFSLELLGQSPKTDLTGGVDAVLGFSIPVRDVEASGAWYSRVLGFQDVTIREEGIHLWDSKPRTSMLRLGDEVIWLREDRSSAHARRRRSMRSNDPGFQHLAIVVSNMPEAYARLRAAGVEHISAWPQRIPDSNPAAAGVEAFYFKDPDGHPLELIWFPSGKGDSRWQSKATGLFLGIDHTAIVVSDTDRALEFYENRLNLRVAGGSLNSGIEQERLTATAAAKVRITLLKAEKGPRIELLDYLVPSDEAGVTIESGEDADVESLVHVRVAVRGPRGPDAVGVDERSGASRFLVDPDGHVLEVMKP